MLKRTDIHRVLILAGRPVWAWILAAVAITLPASAPVKYGRAMGRFEIALNGPTNGNPFLGVRFSARFTQGNSTIAANGFYRWRWHLSRPLHAGETGRVALRHGKLQRGPKCKDWRLLRHPPSPDNHGPVRVAHTFHFAMPTASRSRSSARRATLGFISLNRWKGRR